MTTAVRTLPHVAGALLMLAAPTVSLAQAKPAAPPAFAKCAACHGVAKGGPHGIGPNLHGVVGRKAGSVAGYAASPSLKRSGVTWNRQTLDRYLINTETVAPGGKMPNVATTPAERQAIIAYLTGLK